MKVLNATGFDTTKAENFALDEGMGGISDLALLGIGPVSD